MVGMTDLCPRLLPPGYRGAGVLLHVTSLPSRHGIGDLGPSAFTFVDCLREAGQEWWQGLPVGPTGWSDSPYQSLSSFAGNGLLISPDLLVEEELLGESDVEGRPFPRWRWITNVSSRSGSGCWTRHGGASSGEPARTSGSPSRSSARGMRNGSRTTVYTGTHDNPTTRGWYDGLPEASRRRLWRHLRRTTGESREVAPALLGLAWSSASALAIAPFQDGLNLGDEARMNVPGRAEGNWRWRCTADTLSPAAFESLRELTTSSSRPGSRRAPLRERAASVAS